MVPLLRFGFSFAALALTIPALAAEVEDARLDDIIVTADRAAGFGASLVQVGTFRNARLIDVPLTVNVIPRALLDAQAASGLYDALRNTAGVTRSQLAGSTYDNIAIRGILVENRTSYRLNGALPVINLVDLPLENKARVEVLKGVGALYYGFAPPSGIINLTSKRPDTDLIAAEIRGNLHGGFGGAIDLSRRFGEGRFGLRVNAGADNVDPGIDNFGGHRWMASLAADAQLGDRVKLMLDIEHVAKDVTETPAIVLPAAVNGIIPLPAVPKPETNLGSQWQRYKAHATNALLRADIRLATDLALTLEGGQALTVRDRDFAQFGAFNAGTGEGVLQFFQTGDQRYRNRNLRGELAGAITTGALTHQLVLGVTQNWRFQNGRANQVSPAAPGPGAIAQNYFTPRAIPVIPVTATLGTAPLNVSDFGAYLFTRSDLSNGDRDVAQLLLGLRYSDYRSSARSAAGALTRYTSTAWTPSVGLVLKPAADISVYATYLQGLEEGGTAPANAANANEVLPPAKSEQYEAGVKANVLTGLVLQGAWFRVTRASAFTDPADRVFKLAGRARYQGFEGSASGEISPNLSLTASVQLLDASFITALNPAQLSRRPENTPKFTASLYGEWRPSALPGFAIGGGLFHVGNRAVNALNQAFIEGTTTYSASLRYRFGNGVTLQVAGDNLGNARYWSAAGNGLLGVGLPRTIKLSARASF
ncbi:TonB-dependent siderophore receptor [Sandaracinobacteroides saxicola]|uniref:TonB-dependent siderophore receptor n=1 Tax=Sandaracinobacteroides saxicola TaxID=2759707 RepID=A0A7G5IHZ9_9SPHN|nr:TonB-dependent siderophore receptor [Sandaracinobacteroides saxicola]QMW22991.1 TonB-dependent siderophore receptor [Sandaracinobacteroides saxicola]